MKETKPKFAFCGYPVAGYLPVERRDPARPELWKPCGNIASPGCAYCDEHAGCIVDDLTEKKLLTAGDIVDRATARQQGQRSDFLLFVVAAVVVLIALSQPIHAWLHTHIEFLGGVLAGSVATGTWWGIWRWRRGDRPR